MKLLTIVGARPQFIKAAAIAQVLKTRKDIEHVLVHTGQHYDGAMSQVFFQQLDIPKPSYNLAIGSANHGAQTGRMLEAIETVLQQERPDCVIVYGDTNSTLAGSLAAVKLHIPVAHIEAGLRSFNRRMPEEINRIVSDHTADLLFPPTEVAYQRLIYEGVVADKVFNVGDVMLDVALYYGAKAETDSDILRQLKLVSREYCLATIHRAENTSDTNRLFAIVNAFIELSKRYHIVLPIHPRTKKCLQQHSLLQTLEAHIQLIDPVSFLDMILLERSARLIITDSGGVQKEAFFHSVPCVTLRNETEWTESVELNWNQLLPPTSAEKIVNGVTLALQAHDRKLGNPYGDGHAAGKIIKLIQEHTSVLATCS